jgi:hypothetical protein
MLARAFLSNADWRYSLRAGPKPPDLLQAGKARGSRKQRCGVGNCARVERTDN